MSAPLVNAARLGELLGDIPLGRPAYRGLADALRLLIIDGRIPSGTRLPSERDLTAALGFSRTTVSHAYGELAEREYASARRGSGTVTRLPGSLRDVPVTAFLPRSGADDADRSVVDLTCAASAAVPGTQRAYERALEQMPAQLTTTGYHPDGLAALRAQIAARYAARGLPTEPGQIVVTAGALAATAVVARALTGIGDRVLLESPTYPNMVEAFRRSGARTVPLPMDSSGWHVPTLEATVRQTSPRIAMLIPDFHNPTGALMDDETRQRIVAVLTRTSTTCVVDETLVDTPLDVEPAQMPRPMAAFGANVISIGSASKAFWGGLRIGWIRAPRSMAAMFVEARASLDLGSGVLDQLVVTHLLAEADTILTVRRESLLERRAALLVAVRDMLPGWAVSVPPGGLSLWCRMPDRVSSALVIAAERRGVLLASGSVFGVAGPLESYLRLPFTATVPALLDAVARIAAAYPDALRGAAGPGARRGPLIA
ncbi:MAG: PLP-dependent aminotransferase family protein [Nocardioidaceae bacterium]